MAPLMKGMIDNRYLDQYITQKPPLLYTTTTQKTRITATPFVMVANSSFDPECEDLQGRAGDLFSLYGSYDQRMLDRALEAAGITQGSLFRSDWLGLIGGVPWSSAGKFESYGVACDWYHAITKNFGFGGSAGILYAQTALRMVRDSDTLLSLITGPGDEREIFLANGDMQRRAGITTLIWSDTSLTDCDFYIKALFDAEYRYKFRRLQAGARLGILMPAAAVRDINNPVSIPLGGNGHWGVYARADLDCVLKDDLSAGFMLQLTKRISKNSIIRMPALTESINFGTLTGCALVDPGPTLGFMPYIYCEGMRSGLGFKFAYTLVYHWPDTIVDMRGTAAVPANSSFLREKSCWAAEHVTLGLFYDMGYGFDDRGITPVFTFFWDIPVNGSVSKNAFRTNGIGLSIEMVF
jgi:hypothetical protein